MTAERQWRNRKLVAAPDHLQDILSGMPSSKCCTVNRLQQYVAYVTAVMPAAFRHYASSEHRKWAMKVVFHFPFKLPFWFMT